MFPRKIIPRKIKFIAIIAFACTTTIGSIAFQVESVRSQTVETTQANTPLTTKDPEIPEDQLKLLAKPLTLGELEIEAAAWLVLLREKVQKISDTEIAIKKQNQQIIGNQEEAVKALEEAKKKLEEAKKAQANTNPGTPEYERGLEKVEEARVAIDKAQEAIDIALETKEEIEADESTRNVIQEAQQDLGREKLKQDLEEAEKELEEARQAQEKATPGSFEFGQNVQRIQVAREAVEKAEIALAEKIVEEAQIELDQAQETQQSLTPNTPEYQTATTEVEKAQDALEKAEEDLENKKKAQEVENQNQTSTATANQQTEEELERNKEQLEQASEFIQDDNTSGNELDALIQKAQQLDSALLRLEQLAESEEDLKNQIVANVTKLQTEQASLIERFNLVLDELDRKGGDSESYRTYIRAVQGIELDITDTEGLGVRILTWVKSEEGGIKLGIDAAMLIGIFIAAFIVSRVLARVVNFSLSKFGLVSSLLREFIVVSIKRGGLIIGFLVGLSAIGVNLGPILALIGGLSFILAFALQSNLGNIASGLMMLINKPFDIGDEVQVDGIWGYVKSIDLATTKFQGWKKEIISLPNNTVWGGKIINLSKSEVRAMSIPLHVEASQDFGRIREILLDIAKNHPLVLETPAPSVFYWEYQANYVEVYFSVKSKQADFWKMWDQIICIVIETFRKEGIGIAIPVSVELDSYPKMIKANGNGNGNGSSVNGEIQNKTIDTNKTSTTES